MPHNKALESVSPNRSESRRGGTLKTVRVAAVQAESVVLDRESTVEKASGLIAEAAGKGAKTHSLSRIIHSKLRQRLRLGGWSRTVVARCEKSLATALAQRRVDSKSCYGSSERSGPRCSSHDSDGVERTGAG